MKTPVTILVGEEPFLLQREVERIRQSVLAGTPTPFNQDQFSAKSTPIHTILDACELLPMGGGCRLVIVTEVDVLKKEDLTTLQGYFARPVPSSHLLLLAAKLDRRIKLWQGAQKQGWFVEVKVPYPNQWVPWIQREIQAHGLKAMVDAQQALADAVGIQPMALVTALSQLQTYIHPRQLIELKDVEALFGGYLAQSVFQLTDLVGNGRLAEAIALIEQLLLRGESAVRINALIGRHFKLLLLAQEGLASGIRDQELARLLGVHPFFVKDYVSQAKRFHVKKLKKNYCLTLETDNALKSSPLSGRTVLDRFLLATTTA